MTTALTSTTGSGRGLGASRGKGQSPNTPTGHTPAGHTAASHTAAALSLASQISSSPTAVASALAQLEQALTGIEALDPAVMSLDALRTLVVGMQRLNDRYTSTHARFVHYADRIAVWAGSGSRNVAGWLADSTNASYGKAAEMLKLGHSMEASPHLAQQLHAGAISTATAAALHEAIVMPPSAATAADIEQLVNLCSGISPREAKEAVEDWKAQLSTETPEQAAARQYARRSVRFGQPADGMATNTAVLPVHDTDALRKLLISLGGELSEENPRTTEQCLADGLLNLIGIGARVDDTSTTKRTTATLLVTVDAATLEGTADNPGITEFGNKVPAHVVRQLGDNALLHRVVMAGDTVINVGRGQRLATDKQYLALVARDGGCRVKGCTMPAAWCDVDHILAWEHGGTTDLGNLWLLCPHHHRLKHQPGVKVVGSGHDLALLLPSGTTIECPPGTGRLRRTSAAA